MTAPFPSDILRIHNNLTSGAANALTTGAIVAAPGVGLHLRLWGFQAFPTSTPQVVANWRLSLTDGPPATALYASCQSSGFGTNDLMIIPGGIRVASNTSIGYQFQSALAALLVTAVVYYTIEND